MRLVAQHLDVGVLEQSRALLPQLGANRLLHAGIVQFTLPGDLAVDAA